MELVGHLIYKIFITFVENVSCTPTGISLMGLEIACHGTCTPAYDHYCFYVSFWIVRRTLLVKPAYLNDQFSQQ